MDSKHIFGGLYSSRRQKIKASETTRTKKKLKSSGNDVIIVGAGVAGSALAYALAKDGWRVHVIERDLTEPNVIVDCLDGSRFSDSLRVSLQFTKMGKRSAISYPSHASGRGFHHGRFVQKLREKTASLPKYSSFPLQPIGTE
ncbi:hypothetical protein OIU78_022301 [Salix suchowensis]|nr:hypothetical protein OIU78_022301 [Salix suchowensis]